MSLISQYLRYKAKLQLRADLTEEQKAQMLARQQAAMEESSQRQGRVRQYLGSFGVPVTANFGYQAAGAQAAGIKRTFTGATRDNMLNALVNKWTALGLDPARLDEIVTGLA